MMMLIYHYDDKSQTSLSLCRISFFFLKKKREKSELALPLSKWNFLVFCVCGGWFWNYSKKKKKTQTNVEHSKKKRSRSDWIELQNFHWRKSRARNAKQQTRAGVLWRSQILRFFFLSLSLSQYCCSQWKFFKIIMIHHHHHHHQCIHTNPTTRWHTHTHS